MTQQASKRLQRTLKQRHLMKIAAINVYSRQDITHCHNRPAVIRAAIEQQHRRELLVPCSRAVPGVAHATTVLSRRESTRDQAAQAHDGNGRRNEQQAGHATRRQIERQSNAHNVVDTLPARRPYGVIAARGPLSDRNGSFFHMQIHHSENDGKPTSADIQHRAA